MKIDVALKNNLIHEYISLPSTQDEAKRLAALGVERAVVTAEEQTAGRGRCGRIWSSVKGGGIYFSILSRPKISPSLLPIISLIAGMSVQQALMASKILAALKWPNDVMIESKKICGILSESALEPEKIRYCITGIGINCKKESIPDELLSKACALDEFISSAEINRKELLLNITENFFTLIAELKNSGSEKIIEEYVSNCSTIGRNVRIETDNETMNGTATGISEWGELIVNIGGANVKKFSAADVFHAALV